VCVCVCECFTFDPQVISNLIPEVDCTFYNYVCGVQGVFCGFNLVGGCHFGLLLCSKAICDCQTRPNVEHGSQTGVHRCSMHIQHTRLNSLGISLSLSLARARALRFAFAIRSNQLSL
jgi:hypothetical protein